MWAQTCALLWGYALLGANGAKTTLIEFQDVTNVTFLTAQTPARSHFVPRQVPQNSVRLAEEKVHEGRSRARGPAARLARLTVVQSVTDIPSGPAHASTGSQSHRLTARADRAAEVLEPALRSVDCDDRAAGRQHHRRTAYAGRPTGRTAQADGDYDDGAHRTRRQRRQIPAGRAAVPHARCALDELFQLQPARHPAAQADRVHRRQSQHSLVPPVTRQPLVKEGDG